MLNKLFILLALVALASSMGRPFRSRQHYQDCSCENHHDDSVPCNDSEEPTPPDSQEETTPADSTTPKIIRTVPTTTKTTTTPTTTQTTTLPTTTRTTTASTTIRTTTTQLQTTTSDDPGCPESDLIPFRRKNGWWCEIATIYDMGIGTLGTPMSKTYASNNCALNNYTLSSLELDEEWVFWHSYLMNIGYISGVWVAIGRNDTSGDYYWNDGQAVPEIKFGQPSVVLNNGLAAWVVDKNSTTVPFGRLAVVAPNGANTPPINMGICGVPGRQFN